MTVAELMKLLADVDPGAIVLTEGCDCIGPGDGIEVDEIGKDSWRDYGDARFTVTINRNDCLYEKPREDPRPYLKSQKNLERVKSALKAKKEGEEGA